jgi:AmmeMemoRadiSam system protein B
MSIRKAVFAGSWYPADARSCEKEIQGFLKAARSRDVPLEHPAAGVVPHAGWYFSGGIACDVIHRLADGEPADVVILFGMHLRPSDPCFIMARGSWETPFGALDVDEELARELVERFDFRVETPDNFVQDNTIELQLPFVKYFHPEARIVPMGVPPVTESLEIGKTAARLATRAGKRVRIVGSTDLTHYGSNYGFSPKGAGPEAVRWVRDENDRRVIDAMLAMAPDRVIEEGISRHNACCAGAAATAIAASRELGADRAHEVAYATSYDKSPGESFVGYVGVVFGN